MKRREINISISRKFIVILSSIIIVVFGCSVLIFVRVQEQNQIDSQYVQYSYKVAVNWTLPNVKDPSLAPNQTTFSESGQYYYDRYGLGGINCSNLANDTQNFPIESEIVAVDHDMTIPFPFFGRELATDGANLLTISGFKYRGPGSYMVAVYFEITRASTGTALFRGTGYYTTRSDGSGTLKY